MKVTILTLLAASALPGADVQALALALKAQSDFDRVQLVPAPSLNNTAACIQTQAALLPVAPPEDLPLIHFRKGYCTLAGAVIANDGGAFRMAAAEFDKTVETWPGRAAVAARKKQPVEPVSSAVRVLAQVARLLAGTDDTAVAGAGKELASALRSQACPGSVMPASLCGSLLDIGRQWQGWMALRRDDLPAAARDFPPATAPGWAAWTAGKQAFEERKYADSASAYRRAVDDWEARRRQEPVLLPDRLAPPADLARAYTELGGAQLVSGDTSGAIATLNQAVKEAPLNARAMFLRARARETAGQPDAAMTDYSLAARTAFANAQDLASGEAHLYRGILLYRRKNFAQAEDEFSSALNFEIPADLRADAVAWRRLAAVAGGSCHSGPALLAEALGAVSPYFPSDEARAAISGCKASTAARS